MNKTLLTVIFSGLALAISFGCETRRKGPLERAGERTDEIIDNVKDGENPLRRKGTMEKAGEAIDDELNDNRRKR